MAELDHVVIHVDDLASTLAFYTGLLAVDTLPSPEAVANPLDAVVFRLGDIQINVHGPWPGLDQPCCPPPWAMVTYGPVRAFGAKGWGQSIYTRDPSGNGIEIIHYR